MHHERDLIFPALTVLIENDGACATRTLIDDIKNSITLDEEDLALLPSADFCRIDQIIRNLKSNKTLEKLGVATYFPGGFELTDFGLGCALQESDAGKLRRAINKLFDSKSNALTLQQATVLIVKEQGLRFKDGKKAREGIQSQVAHFHFSDDDTRLQFLRMAVDKYVTNNPSNVL